MDKALASLTTVPGNSVTGPDPAEAVSLLANE